MTNEYIVASDQQGKVAFANSEWISPLQGQQPSVDDLQSCPEPHDFLNAKGAEKWDLVSVVVKTIDDGQHNIQIFLRREINSQNACVHTVPSRLTPETSCSPCT